MSAQGQGGTAGGGYNPQPMPGYTGQSNYTGVPQGWDMTLGSAPSNGNWNPANYQQGVASMPGTTPDWLKNAMGNLYAQPMVTDPTQYGRWNWAQNLQGGGPPSPFGQYAQQTAQYPALQYPQPPGAQQPGAQPTATPAPPVAAAAPNVNAQGLINLPANLAQQNPTLAAFLAKTRDPNYQNTQANENRLGPAGWNAWNPYGGAGALDANGQPVRSLAQQQGIAPKTPQELGFGQGANAGMWQNLLR
jgi:hypothetical protein